MVQIKVSVLHMNLRIILKKEMLSKMSGWKVISIKELLECCNYERWTATRSGPTAVGFSFS